MEGNNVEKRLAGLPPGGLFRVAELGFGTGLNFALTVEAFLRLAPPGTRLHYWAVEGYPLPPAMMAKAHAALSERDPSLQRALQLMATASIAPRPGVTHRQLTDRISLTLCLGPVEDVIGQGPVHADAWYLDGFAPRTNPDMWDEPVLTWVANNIASVPRATGSTFTVAGAVRRCLAEGGVEIEKRPGFGRKREMLWMGSPKRAPYHTNKETRILIIGAGIAGATAAWHLCQTGADVTVVEAETPGAGASGNPVGMVMPRLDAGLHPIAAFYRDAYLYAAHFYELACPGAILDRGGVILENPDTPDRFTKVRDTGLWHPDDLQLQDDGSLLAPGALLLSPQRAVSDLLDGVNVTRAQVTDLNLAESGIEARLATSGQSGRLTLHFDHVLIACGPAAAHLHPALNDLTASRGQLDIFKGTAPNKMTSRGRYAAPLPHRPDQVAIGATYDNVAISSTEALQTTQASTDENRAGGPGLGVHDVGEVVSSRAALRAVTPDKHPVFGALDDASHLFAITGLGSRGLVTAPLLAASLAATWSNAPLPTYHSALDALRPSRFEERRIRRGG